MKAKVNYNENQEPSTVTIKERGVFEAKLNVKDGTAVITSILPAEGEDRVYGEDIRRAKGYVVGLEFVEEVQLAENDALE